MPASRGRAASFSGVCPPRLTITPAARPARRASRQIVSDVLARERLEEEPVAGVVVGRDRLGIAVDHDGLVAGGREGERCVHAAVVELDALADAVRPAAEDHDRRLVERRHLVLVLERPVVVRRPGLELGCAGVDGLVRDADAGLESRRPHGVLVGAPEVRELGVGESEPLRPAPVPAGRTVERDGGEAGALLHDLEDPVEEPGVDAGRVGEPLDGDAPPQGALEREQAVGRRHRGGAHEIVGAERASGSSAGSQFTPRRPVSNDRIAFWSDSGNVRPMAIASPTDCIIVPSVGVAPGSFSNAHRGIFVTT